MHPDLSAFLDHLRAVQKSPLTITRYGDVLRDLDAFTGAVATAAITRETLRRFVSAPRKDGSSRASAGVNLRLAVVRTLFRYLSTERGLAENPAAKLVAIPLPRRTPKYLTTLEVQRLVRHVAGRTGLLRDRNLTLVILFWQTGLRVREVARLNGDQLDVEARRLRDVLRKGGHVLDALLNQETLSVIEAYLASRGELEAGAPLFVTEAGRRLSVRAIQALFETWRLELGWTRPLHPHVLRHTHATGALEDGADLATVADLLGHQGLRTVMVYAHVQDRARRDALTKLGSHVPRSVLPVRSPGGSSKTPPQNVIPLGERSCTEEPFDAAA